MADDLMPRLVGIVEQCPALMTVLRVVREQDLPDALLFSGAVYQTVWNNLTGRPCTYGIKDYDVGYYDPDTTLKSEDDAIQRVSEALDPALRHLVEVRNQARVHLWFPQKFGHPYAPLQSTAEALERFVCPAFAVGIRLEDDDGMLVVAPFGLKDVFDMKLRVNPVRGLSLDWDRIVASATARWPELVVEAPA